MPELPEVESIRRSLQPRLLGRIVRDAVLHRRDVLVAPGDPFGGFARQRSPATQRSRPRRVPRSNLLMGATITRLERRGKQLAIIGQTEAGELALVVQLGMSGQLVHCAPGQRADQTDHIHAAWRFDDGRLLFRDPRRFGGLRIFSDIAALHDHWAALGPDALTLTPDQLARGLARSTRAVKAALLDQCVVAGIGNIYADEALFAARISPLRHAADLSDDALAALSRAITHVLVAAVAAGGSTLRDYVNAQGRPGSFQLSHAVYGRAGEPCLRCRSPLAATTVAQRTTVWCPRCQR